MVRLVPLPEALEALGGICKETFRLRWREVFTDRRANGQCRGRGSPRVILSDELEAAVEGGPAAVELLRKRKGRA